MLQFKAKQIIDVLMVTVFKFDFFGIASGGLFLSCLSDIRPGVGERLRLTCRSPFRTSTSIRPIRCGA